MKQTTDIILDRKIALQRASLLWERLWAALHWPLVTAGLAAIAVSSGVLLALPQPVRWGVLLTLAGAFIWSLRPALKLPRPDDLAAMRRMETAASLEHRALSSKDETVAIELDTPDAQGLWAEHKRRQLAKLLHITISPPRSFWRDFDPRALRVPVALGLVASLLLGSGSFTATIKDMGNMATLAPPPAITIDAWLKPPAYTSKPPLLITSAAMQEKLKTGSDILVPENATLTVRATGVASPRLEFHTPGGPVSDATLLKDLVAKSATTESGFTAEARLTRPSIIRMMDGSTEIAAWPVSVIPDGPPAISFPKPVKIETGGSLTLFWETKDDYGVRSIASDVSLADEQEGGIGFASDGPFLYEPPAFPVALKKSNAKTESGKSTHDLTAHPWAGLNISLTLTAKDGGGNETASPPLTITLPERVFTRPLAKALIEQRKRLVMVPDKAVEIADLFRALLLYPIGLIERSGHHIRLAAISSHLENSASNEDIKTIVADLWQLALDIEDGNLADAKAELSALKKQLADAIKNGASEQEIAKLMDKMRDAMNRYMDAMRKDMEQRNQQADKNQNSQQDQNGQQQMVTREDLQRMMDMIEKLSKDGKQDMAQALLDELDRMLQNMKPGDSQQAGEQGDPLGEMLDQLSDMMRQQQRLMDETQRMPGQGEEPGEQGQDGKQPGQNPGGLSDRQGALGDMLDRMMREMGRNAPGELGEAGREMRGAQGSLGQSDKDGALQQQGNALDQLRKGSKAMRKQMRQGQGQARNRGRDGEAGGTDDDPLGRPRATRNPDDGPDKDMVPNELASRRAREILEQLRSRANEQGLMEQERGYIDRLLRGLY